MAEALATAGYKLKERERERERKFRSWDTRCNLVCETKLHATSDVYV